jgi:hypothetical protein
LNLERVFRFGLTGLIVVSLCLFAAGAFVTKKLLDFAQSSTPGRVQDMSDAARHDGSPVPHEGPWGELLAQDITLERPVDYLREELKTVHTPVWTFHRMTIAQVKTLFSNGGLTSIETEKALAPPRLSVSGADMLFTPSAEFVLSLDPARRNRLYEALRGLDVNLCLDSPYHYSQAQLEWINRDTCVHPDDRALFKKLVYGGSEIRRFSDYETLMGRIPTLERRVAMAASLSRQPAVLARLRIRPGADVDKVIHYWGHIPNVRFIDFYPLLEALKGLPAGGTISLLHLLPPFARERLYTFAPPPAPGEPIPDCHWTTFNFSNVKPDNRFLDPAECAQHVDQDFYRIAQPSIYGDLVLFRNNRGQISQSGVYLASDLVFTKIGKGYMTPWVIMHIADLEAMFSNCTSVYVRIKSD